MRRGMVAVAIVLIAVGLIVPLRWLRRRRRSREDALAAAMCRAIHRIRHEPVPRTATLREALNQLRSDSNLCVSGQLTGLLDTALNVYEQARFAGRPPQPAMSRDLIDRLDRQSRAASGRARGRESQPQGGPAGVEPK